MMQELRIKGEFILTKNKKNLLIILLFTLFAIGKSHSQIINLVKQKEYTCVDSTYTNIRSAPSIRSAIISKEAKYTPLQILEKKEKWTKVKGLGFEGWIYNKLVNSNYECITTQDSSPECPGKKTIQRSTTFNEGFKVIKSEVGCLYVKDIYSKKHWIGSLNIWPNKYSEKLQI